MAFFRRKKEEKPSVPEIPPLPELKRGKDTEAIKEAVGEEEEEFEIPERKPRILRADEMQEESAKRALSRVVPSEGRALFVKIDKYEDAIDKLNEIREKLDEAENLLRNISELRQKEEEELNSWQKEIEEIKNMLMTVDQDIFEE